MSKNRTPRIVGDDPSGIHAVCWAALLELRETTFGAVDEARMAVEKALRGAVSAEVRYAKANAHASPDAARLAERADNARGAAEAAVRWKLLAIDASVKAAAIHDDALALTLLYEDGAAADTGSAREAAEAEARPFADKPRLVVTKMAEAAHEAEDARTKAQAAAGRAYEAGR